MNLNNVQKQEDLMLEAFRKGDTIEDSRMYKLLKSKIEEVWSNY